MIYSRYNLQFKTEDGKCLIYNSLSNSFAELSKELYDMLSNLKDKNISVNELDSNLLKRLVEKKIIVENDLDEYYNIKFQTLLNRFYNKSLALTIAPTRDCNFNCNYCFEKEKLPIYIDNETINNLIKFIESYKDVDLINICWYGGEPLLAFDKIEEITNKIIKRNKKVSADLITNGYLLKEDIIKKLDELFINDIQITLDGMKNTHNKKRPHKHDKDSFTTIINNLDLLAKYSENRSISIRYNIDHYRPKLFRNWFKSPCIPMNTL